MMPIGPGQPRLILTYPDGTMIETTLHDPSYHLVLLEYLKTLPTHRKKDLIHQLSDMVEMETKGALG